MHFLYESGNIKDDIDVNAVYLIITQLFGEVQNVSCFWNSVILCKITLCEVKGYVDTVLDRTIKET